MGQGDGWGLKFWRQSEKFGQSQFLKTLACVCVVFYFMKRDMKFTRGSCCVARDEFLVTFKGDHILINMYISYLQRVIVGHCIALRYIV